MAEADGEDVYGSRPDPEDLRRRCSGAGGVLVLDPATGVLTACVDAASSRVLFRETGSEIADGSAPAEPRTERERAIRYLCHVYPASQERRWRALSTDELAGVLGRLEVAFELPHPPAALLRGAAEPAAVVTAPPLGRTTHRTLCSARGMGGVRFEPARSTLEACTGFRDGLGGEVLVFETPTSAPDCTLAYACRGSGVHLRMEPGTLTFPNAVQALAEVATPREVVAVLCRAKREALRGGGGGGDGGVDDEAFVRECATGAGLLVGEVDVQPTFEEDEGLFELLMAKYGALTPTLQLTEQPVWTPAGRRHALVLLATQGVTEVSRRRLQRLDPFGGGVTLRSEA